MKAKIYFSVYSTRLTEALLHDSLLQCPSWENTSCLGPRLSQIKGKKNGPLGCIQEASVQKQHTTFLLIVHWPKQVVKTKLTSMGWKVLSPTRMGPEGTGPKDVQGEEWNVWSNHTTYRHYMGIVFMKYS